MAGTRRIRQAGIAHGEDRRVGEAERRKGERRKEQLGEAGFTVDGKPAFRTTDTKFSELPQTTKLNLKVVKGEGKYVYLKDGRRPGRNKRK
ncbi:MAG: hypothetical protein NUV67_03015 [archaeon]|nr:hypothetical protein [archaeon]